MLQKKCSCRPSQNPLDKDNLQPAGIFYWVLTTKKIQWTNATAIRVCCK